MDQLGSQDINIDVENMDELEKKLNPIVVKENFDFQKFKDEEKLLEAEEMPYDPQNAL